MPPFLSVLDDYIALTAHKQETLQNIPKREVDLVKKLQNSRLTPEISHLLLKSLMEEIETMGYMKQQHLT